ncbi:MAG: hypothetical protein LBG06_04265 [Deltaproteobacteria bacterium]|nr:hypothetical protein [Deltaproteobacteria bacterium]
MTSPTARNWSEITETRGKPVAPEIADSTRTELAGQELEAVPADWGRCHAAGWRGHQPGKGCSG